MALLLLLSCSVELALLASSAWPHNHPTLTGCNLSLSKGFCAFICNNNFIRSSRTSYAFCPPTKHSCLWEAEFIRPNTEGPFLTLSWWLREWKFWHLCFRHIVQYNMGDWSILELCLLSVSLASSQRRDPKWCSRALNAMKPLNSQVTAQSGHGGDDNYAS